MKYTNIVFLQGDDANTALNILEEKGHKAAFRHLLLWEHLDKGDIRKESSAGTADDIYKFQVKGGYKYIMAVNTDLNYIGLERVIEKKGA